ncbi:ribosome recycling factor family protein [Paraferrimonas sp. SM1919]|uniref:ribosome recycling factor family protein n=1 Tax=Paraferrimonas sp. SM1919 TaxID=2662263 RepID=UPI0013D156B8|nr:ribosome recycling factor family protein [Paraferrimonas sp. SM1919]
MLSVPLPSLIHRIGKAKVETARSTAANFSCQLKRVRRSRNWQLIGELGQLDAFSQHLKSQDDHWQYLIGKCEAVLSKHAAELEPIETKLAKLIAKDCAITVAKLMQQTECTLAQARVALAESF